MTVLSSPARLAALARSGLLTKPPTERLRHLVYSVYVLLNADAAQANVLTDSLQHTAVEWPRVAPPRADIDPADSGCRLVLEAGQTLLIPNALDHPVACTLPWAASYRGYIGTPLVYEGEYIGALCALTVRPREWTALDRMSLEGLSQLVMAAVT